MKKYAKNKTKKHRSRTISKRDFGRIYRNTANDVNQIRVLRAEQEDKTPMCWADFGYWNTRKQKEIYCGRMALVYGKLYYLINRGLHLLKYK